MRRDLISIGLFFLVVAALGTIYVRAERNTAYVPSTPAVQAGETKVIAYYLHVTARCNPCRAIESYSREVIEQKFAADIVQGRLQIRLVNVQLTEDRHFIKDYQIYTKSLVLVRFEKADRPNTKSSTIPGNRLATSKPCSRTSNARSAIT